MDKEIKEFHLFAGIGGGIYGGQFLGHHCCGGVEVDDFCKNILFQRQSDGWMDDFPIYSDIRELDGFDFRGKFTILCGGFPCQAFSHAAHGKNIASKNLWGEMFRFVKESDAPIVFAENVTEKAIETAKQDLESVGYKVHRCRLSCDDIGADHRRNRFWLLAVKDEYILYKVVENDNETDKIQVKCWTDNPLHIPYEEERGIVRKQLKAIGNAQSPFVAAIAFRILLNRHINNITEDFLIPKEDEIDAVCVRYKSWIKTYFPDMEGGVHTPTTMANYCCPSMMKHLGCRNYLKIFGHPTPKDAEYLMGFPIGASSMRPMDYFVAGKNG